MPRFVLFVATCSRRFTAVNPEQVTRVVEESTGCTLWLQDGRSVRVRGGVLEVAAKLAGTEPRPDSGLH